MYEAVIFGDDLMQCVSFLCLLAKIYTDGSALRYRASIRSTIDSVNLEYIIPLPKKDDDETAWVDRLLVVVQHLTEKQLVPFFSFTRLGDRCVTFFNSYLVAKTDSPLSRRPNAFDAFINASEQNNVCLIFSLAHQDLKNSKKLTRSWILRAGSSMTRNKRSSNSSNRPSEELPVRPLSLWHDRFFNANESRATVRLPDSSKVTEDLGKFVKANEKQLYKLIRILVDPQTDLKLLLKTYVRLSLPSIAPGR